MTKVAFTNTKKHAVHIGNKTIMPGDTKEVEETLHPDYRPPAVAQPEAEPTLVEQLAEAAAKDAINALNALDEQQLQQLADIEGARKKPRKSLIEAIAKLQLERAQQEPLEGSLEAFEQQLATHSDEMLAELAGVHADDENLLELIHAEIAKRAAAE